MSAQLQGWGNRAGARGAGTRKRVTSKAEQDPPVPCTACATWVKLNGRKLNEESHGIPVGEWIKELAGKSEEILPGQYAITCSNERNANLNGTQYFSQNMGRDFSDQC